VASVNARLSAVKTYARLAMKAGTITPEEHALIRAVSGYSPKEGKRVDERREVTRLARRRPSTSTSTRSRRASSSSSLTPLRAAATPC
jgi:hypothetical protein